MKSKLKKFLKEKKDLLIFMGVLVLTFASVITIASIATRKTEKPASGTVDVTPTTPQDNPQDNPSSENPPKPTVYPFSLPIEGEYVISREFFDLNLEEEMLTNAVMTSGTTFTESKGISYSKKDNSIFDVLSVYPGTVTKIIGEEDSLEGYTVTILHADDVISVYSSLSKVTVAVGDNVKASQKIGVSGTSVKDMDAGVHVHLELLQNGVFINPKEAIGKQTSELVSAVK